MCSNRKVRGRIISSTLWNNIHLSVLGGAVLKLKETSYFAELTSQNDNLKTQWEKHHCYTKHLMPNTGPIRDSKLKGQILTRKKQRPLKRQKSLRQRGVKRLSSLHWSQPLCHCSVITRSTTTFLTHSLYQATETVLHLLLNTIYDKEIIHKGTVNLIAKKKICV